MPLEQTEIAGTERLKIPEINRAAASYEKVRDERMALTTKEVAAKQKLIDVMIEHQEKLPENGDGEKVYAFGDEVVVLKNGKVGVKIRPALEEVEEEEAE